MHIIKILQCFVVGIILLFHSRGYAQISNDDCVSAIAINTAEDFCGDYDNSSATASIDSGPSCWPSDAVTNDIWFSIRPTRQVMLIKIFSDVASGGLSEGSVGVYSGRCNNLIQEECESQVTATDAFEIYVNQLTIGQRYYIRIDSRRNVGGPFQLCIEQFNPVPAPEQDCNLSVKLCDKSSFSVELLEGAGLLTDEADDSCLDTDPSTGRDDGDSEDRSAWYTWTCKDAGSLTFSLTPNNTVNISEDLDFALFRLPDGISDCSTKELIRCMASGETVGESLNYNLPCFGPTGLREGSTDFFEERGCGFGSDNFLAPINMEVGESYALLVNNFTASGLGFTIDFGGTGTFQGPEPDFDIDILAELVLQCEKEVLFKDQSIEFTDNIVDWIWNFGTGAEPQFASGSGPHAVSYNTFGSKSATLEVVTSRGCRLTTTQDIDVQPCCQPGTNIDPQLNKADIVCFGDMDGSININPVGGSGIYDVSFNDDDFESIFSFEDLDVGRYKIEIIDEKGCLATIEADILQNPPIEIDAGPDQSIDLGFSTELMATYGPDTYTIDIEWNESEDLSCLECPDPTVIPMMTTTYTITATNEFSCTDSSMVTITTIVDREGQVYAPQIFSPNDDGENDFFKLFGGIAVRQIDKLYIFNEWGDLVYEGFDLPKDDSFSLGWDGKFMGLEVNPGVYAWNADVAYIDDVVETLKGTITLIR